MPPYGGGGRYGGACGGDQVDFGGPDRRLTAVDAGYDGGGISAGSMVGGPYLASTGFRLENTIRPVARIAMRQTIISKTSHQGTLASLSTSSSPDSNTSEVDNGSVLVVLVVLVDVLVSTQRSVTVTDW